MSCRLGDGGYCRWFKQCSCCLSRPDNGGHLSLCWSSGHTRVLLRDCRCSTGEPQGPPSGAAFLLPFIHVLICQTGNMGCYLCDGHSVIYKQDLISSNVPLAPSLTSHAPSPCSGFSPRPSDMLCACLLVVYLVSVSSIRAGLSVLFTAESSSPGTQQALSKCVDNADH